jgi:hypothetical protein
LNKASVISTVFNTQILQHNNTKIKSNFRNLELLLIIYKIIKPTGIGKIFSKVAFSWQNFCL